MAVKNDILKSDSDYIVIPVNMVGVMGAGLAKQFAKTYPEHVQEYVTWCQEYALRPQQICIGGRFIMLPTKYHWRDNSDIKTIRREVSYMYTYMIPHYRGKSVALPLLGAGLGGLDPKEVKSMLKKMGTGAEALWDIQTDVFG